MGQAGHVVDVTGERRGGGQQCSYGLAHCELLTGGHHPDPRKVGLADDPKKLSSHVSMVSNAGFLTHWSNFLVFYRFSQLLKKPFHFLKFQKPS